MKAHKNLGITLIALIITIVILLILAGVSINLLVGDNGIITKAEKTAFITEMRAYQETVEKYILAKELTAGGEDYHIYLGLENQEGIETVITNIKNEYKDQVIVQDKTMYYKYNETPESKKRVKWCFEENIPVWGYGSYEEFEEDVTRAPITTGEYTEVGGVYCCAPDLTGFNIDKTFYVIYDEDGNEIVSNSLRKGLPEGVTWYDYSSSKKIWANIVTIDGDKKSYFVWIPRYVYTIDSESKPKEEVKVKFVDKSNNYIDFETKEVTNYPDTTPTYDENGYQTNYCLPDAFSWDGHPLPGYWISKYEVSQKEEIKDCMIDVTDSSITIQKKTSMNIEPVSYDIYLNDELKLSTTKLPCTITGLNANTEYNVKIVGKASGGYGYASYEEMVKTTEKTIKELTQPSLMGFIQSNTFYVTYDSSDNEVIGNRIQVDSDGNPTNMPDGWYDYENKKWANIVTIDGDKKAYFVWIPRYEYKAKSAWEEIAIRFISTSQTSATQGYSLPDAFSWDGTPLSGYWISKYEVSAKEAIENCMVDVTDSSITIQKKTSMNIEPASYDIYLNDEFKLSATSLPCTVSGLNPDTEYIVKVIGKASGGYEYASYEEMVKTTEKTIKELTQPNLKGFSLDNTYYVTYDSSDNEVIGDKIQVDANGNPKNMPTDWYDYENKKWANIVTIDGDKKAYFVWIPRYEYKTKSAFEEVEIRFISTSQTSATEGYKLPDAFSWDGTPISGYWISKYEVSE